jgi:acyl carrier protein
LPGYVYYILVACVIVAGVFIMRHIDPRIRRIKNRPHLSDEDFAKAFPPQQKEIALKVRQLIAEQLGLDLTLIRPTDNLPEDLGVGTWLDDLAGVELILKVDEAFDIRINNYEAENVMTVSDLIVLVASKPARRALEIATMIPPRHDL